MKGGVLEELFTVALSFGSEVRIEYERGDPEPFFVCEDDGHPIACGSTAEVAAVRAMKVLADDADAAVKRARAIIAPHAAHADGWKGW